LGILNLFAHEGYPGHHTEHQLKEKYLYHQKGYGEVASALLHSPSAVIAEGIATTAGEIIFPGQEIYEWTVEVILKEAGLPAADPEDMEKIATAQRALRYVNGNAAILYHTGELTKEQTVDYIRENALSTKMRAEKAFSFISNPLYRSYIFTYTQGYDLVEQAAGEEKRTLFKRLLMEEFLPSELAVM
jgi:hypothetical protein